MAPQLSTRAIDLVIRLCEQRRAEIAGHVLRMHFGGVGDELIAAGALVEMAPSETVFMRNTTSASTSCRGSAMTT